MPVVVDTKALPTAADVMAVAEEVSVRILENRALALRDFMASQWPNQSNSGPHADGSPSESSGASSRALEVTPLTDGKIGMEWGFGDETNDRGQAVEDYYEYVHFTGGDAGPPGDALESARARFMREADEIIDDIITAALARL